MSYFVANLALALALSMLACGGMTTQAGTADGGQVILDAGQQVGPDSSATVDAGPFACPTNLPGPRLLQVQTPDGHNYCIGATEVTNAQYAAFLAAHPNGPTGQPAVCDWFQNLKPYALCAQTYDPVNRPDYPVACIAWCGALDYCAWAGQHLCGRIGPGPFTDADLVDPKRDEWFNACSASGAHAYPYGDTYQGNACNGADYVDGGLEGGPLPYEQLSSCAGGVAGLLNMSGNVEEWEDACVGTVGKTDICVLRGGDFGAPPLDLRCAVGQNSLAARNVATPAIGIRCCY